ncbi:MAG: hypothetical protein ACI4JX_02685 [Oscillospiraceae bacterium]
MKIDNPILKKALLVGVFLIPPLILLLMGVGVKGSATVGFIVDIFILFAYILYFRAAKNIKEVETEEVSTNLLPILYQLTQEGSVIESVTLMPLSAQVEYITPGSDEPIKSEFAYSSWGIRGDRVYIQASKPIKDFLGKNYKISMFGTAIDISRTEPQDENKAEEEQLDLC